MNLIDIEVLEEIIESQTINFNDLDSSLIFLPKDVNSIIYKFYSGYCIKCENCCNLCKMNCFYQCYRKQRRSDVCCRWNIRAEFRKFGKQFNNP